MKTIAWSVLALLLQGMPHLQAQDMYRSNAGKVRFFSEAPLENIEATTVTASSALRPATGEVAFTIPVRTFKFEKSLMEEHFNENYLESEKYPNATFTGKILEKVNLQATGDQVVMVDGNLTIHGVTQQRQIPVTLRVDGNKIKGHSQFKVKLADHRIDIPKLVFQKIAEVVEVTLDVDYAPQVN